MMTHFLLLSFLPMKKMGETYCDAPSSMHSNAFSCLIHPSSISPSPLDHGYGLHLIELGVFGRNLIVMLGSQFGGNHFESSSKSTFQCLLNSLGIVSIVMWVWFISSRRFHSWARFVCLRNAIIHSGSCPVFLRVSAALQNTHPRYLNLVLWRVTSSPSSFPSVQFICGLNSHRKGYPRIILSLPNAVMKNFWSCWCPSYSTHSQQ